MNPLVSIICLSYNNESFIKKSLDGILMQKVNFAYEIIIHDDASTDNSQKIIKEYLNKFSNVMKPILQIENQYSKGSGIVSRIVFDAAKGKYVAFCEGDDYWIDPYKLQKQVDFLENNSDFGLVHTNCSYLDNDSNKLSKSPFDSSNIIKEGYLFNELIKFNRICTLTVCVRRDIIKKYIQDVDPYKRQWKMGDYPMWLYLSQNAKIKYFDDNTSCYRVLKNSASHFNDFLSVKEFLFKESGLDICIYFTKKYNKKLYLRKSLALYKFYIFQLKEKKIRKFLISRILKKKSIK